MLGWLLKLKQTRKVVIKQMIFLVTFFLFAFLISPYIVHAQTAAQDALGLTQVGNTIALGSEDIRLTIAKIIRVLLGLLGIIALVLMLYAGYTIMTSAGEEDKIITGKKILINATIGLLIILSSFAIVQFFITKLGQATNFLGQNGGATAGRQTFLGSGSLGRVVKDHYPFRDQRDIPRNTRISVTFNYAFDPASVFVNSNNSNSSGVPIYGDCLRTDQLNFDWNADCDHININAIKVFALDAENKETDLVLDMVALASDEGGKFYTIVLRPVAPLGSDRDAVGYSVDLTKDILKEAGGSMFAESRDNHYKWIFYTGTEFDFSPPVVTSVFPFDGETEARNTVLQINFNEPVDPTVTQGKAGVFYQILLQNKITNAVPTGSWRISNGYSTVEFVSDQACGENSCGEPMYCLPSNCALPDCSEEHNVVVRTAALVSLSSWEAVPFSGVTDMSGNALDGNANGSQQGKPLPIGGAADILDDEKNPDNYLWSFDIENKIDRSAPYIKEIVPAIDAEEVTGDAENSLLFSKPMWSATLNGVEITEKLKPADPPVVVDDLWFKPRGQLRVDSITQEKTYSLNISHRLFGPNDEDAYYFTSVSSTVKALNQNCIYPGRGPYSNVRGSSPICNCEVDVNGALVNCTGCVNVNSDASMDTGCVQTALSGPGDITKPDISACLDTMDTISIF